jgi:hypothetical protein
MHHGITSGFRAACLRKPTDLRFASECTDSDALEVSFLGDAL